MVTEQQFEVLFRGQFAALCNFAYSVVKDTDQAHDIVQQAFVNLWERRDEVETIDNLPAYLRRSIVNVAINHIQKHKRVQLEDEYTQAQLDNASAADRSDYLQGEVEEAIRRAVEQLPEKSQLVFSLSRFQGMSNKEIASRFGISVKTVDYHISRALKALRRSLGDYLPVVCIFLSL
jgi:RNA polymerase sigma-70 factor (ECF subfamily)